MQTNTRQTEQIDFEAFVLSTNALACMQDYAPPVITDEPEAETKTAADQVASTIVVAFRNEVMLPLLEAESLEQYHRSLALAVGRFRQVCTALTEIRRTSPRRRVDDRVAATIDAARKFAGEDAAEEVEFATHTYSAAVRMSRRLDSAPAPSDIDADARHLEEFYLGMDLYWIGSISLHLLARGARSNELAAKHTFLLLRAGAMRAYAAARQARDLRRHPSELDGSPELDSEDIALAESEGL